MLVVLTNGAYEKPFIYDHQHGGADVTCKPRIYTEPIRCLQPIPRDPKDNGVAAMLVVLTKGANEKSFVYDHQHGGDDVTCKPRIYTEPIRCLQPVPRDPKDNGVAAMLVVLTNGANEKSFVYDHQYGGDDVTCKPRMYSWLYVASDFHSKTFQLLSNRVGRFLVFK